MHVTIKNHPLGRDQAVKPSDSGRFDASEVIAKRLGERVLLVPVEAPWQLMREALNDFDTSFAIQREQPRQRPRNGLRR